MKQTALNDGMGFPGVGGSERWGSGEAQRALARIAGRAWHGMAEHLNQNDEVQIHFTA
jgi:hypothetical protein